MASIAFTLSSNNLGMLTSSYIVHDGDLERILVMLNEKYATVGPHVDMDKKEEELQNSVKKASTQKLLDILSETIMNGINEQVKQFETSKQYQSYLENYNSIVARKPG